MGGSAIGGDIIATLAARTSVAPIQIVRGYTLPPTDEHTLVVASSFSGDTEETLETFNAALGAPGMRLALTSGGKLGRLADSLGYAVLRYDFEGMPRAALGWGLFPLLAILQRLGVLQLGEGTVEAALTENRTGGHRLEPGSAVRRERSEADRDGPAGPRAIDRRHRLLRGHSAALGRATERKREAVGVPCGPAGGRP